MLKEKASGSRLGIFMISGLLFAAALMLSACNTVSGLGEDVESAGDAVSDTAEDVQD